MHRGLARGGLEFSGFDTHCHLRLDSGRVVRLRGLNQNLTYSGLLEGTPTRDLNDDLIQRAMSEGRDHGAGRRVRLIEPPRRSDDHWSPEKRGLFAEAGIILEWLPAVTCVGWFGDADSELAVVWFQEEFAPPICQPVLVQLRKLDWTTEAHPWTEDNL
jgi:hypothetical protein